MPDTQIQEQKRAAREAREAKRKEYQPKNSVKCLFIAESPPPDIKRFFYFEQVPNHDWLYLTLMEVVFSADFNDMDNKDKTQQLRSNKKEYLTRFCNKGYFLIDAVDDPFERPPKNEKRNQIDSVKRQIIHENKTTLHDKVMRIKNGQNKDFPVILISKNTFYILNDYLKELKISVINNGVIPFPIPPWHKTKSKDIIENLLQDNRIL